MSHKLQETAVSFVQDKFGLKDGEVAYTSGYSSDIADFAYLSQSHHGIPFINAVANLVTKDGNVVTFNSSFVKTDKIAPPTPSIDAPAAIRAAERMFSGAYNGHPVKLEYFVKEDGYAALVYVVQVQDNVVGTWFEVYVDGHNGEVVSSTNFVDDDEGFI